MKKYFFFDFDDTIAASEELNLQTLLEVCEEIIPDFDREYVTLFFMNNKGLFFDDLCRQILVHNSGSDNQLESFLKLNYHKMSQNIKKIILFSDTINYINIIRAKGGKCVIFSNRDKITLELALNANGVSHLFEDVISCPDKGFKKPDPTLLLDYIQKNSIQKSEVIFFGDSKVDKEFAERAGIDFLIIDHYLNEKKVFTHFIQSII